MTKQPEIRYELVAYVDDVIVFQSHYDDTASLQEEGLRKAEYQVEEELKEIESLENFLNAIDTIDNEQKT